ncbi:MAG: hypothetical protein K2F57_06905 [Candidatus Gastranaerophilales bacterium]|nr:hypothetical protein [Candidatus Gastranaerophilales bacterium]
MKKFFLLLLILFSALPGVCVPGTTATYVIDPVKNAFEHNNMGIIYMEEKCYYAAIQEFKMAISLNPKTQATAVYFNNLGKVYMIIGYPEMALDCFQNAVVQYNLNFEFYKNLVDCYEKLNQISEKLEFYKNSSNSNPFDKIMLGLLYAKTGNMKKAIIVLDEFAMSEPNLMITPAVKQYIQQLVDELL